MGVNKNQLVRALQIAKEYSDVELTEAEKRVGALIQALYEVVENKREDPIHQLHENIGLQDNPVGHIMAFMGTKVPSHYLACDGAEYEISAFPALSQHILEQFGAVNYFGGDGVTTFAVPDLRGEFLRGTGTANRNTGTGSAVGTHQDGTGHSVIQVQRHSAGAYYMRGFLANTAIGTDTTITNPDACGTSARAMVQTNPNSVNADTVSNAAWIGNSSVYYASRPTNTSVLYCIKYEPTFYLRAGSDLDYYSDEEVCIGTWIDGSPLYRKVYHTVMSSTIMRLLPDIDNIGTVINVEGILLYNKYSYLSIPSYYGPNDWAVSAYDSLNGHVTINCGSAYINSPATVWMKYTKKSTTS
ncbi:MAG: phage tail protein [Lachnospiraceae bacterium]|nr:phage tail protein [Lachnospiraceae bacterium]